MAGIVAYGVLSLVNGRLRCDLLPTRDELRPSHVWTDVKHHARLEFPTGASAMKYDILLKASSPGVMGVLIPVMIPTGLTMSLAMMAA